MKKTRRKIQPLINVGIRIPPKIWEKVGWYAENRELQKADAVRRLIEDGVKHEPPPVSAETLEIQASGERQRVWQKLAAKSGETLSELIGRTMDFLACQELGPEIDENA